MSNLVQAISQSVSRFSWRTPVISSLRRTKVPPPRMLGLSLWQGKLRLSLLMAEHLYPSGNTSLSRMSLCSHDSDPMMMSGLTESARFCSSSGLLFKDWQFTVSILSDWRGLAVYVFGFGDFWGDEVYMGYPILMLLDMFPALADTSG